MHSINHRNNICEFKIGDIVRFADVPRDNYYGDMKVVDVFVNVKLNPKDKRAKYMYNSLHLVPSNFCSNCEGEDDLSFLDECHLVYERDIYK